MSTKKTLTFLLFAFVLLPFIAAGNERYCFIDNNGNTFDFRGGKVGKKAFLVKTKIACSPNHLSGMATFAKVDDGYEVLVFISRDPAGACNSYQLALFADPDLLVASGGVDALPRSNPPHPIITFTQIACLAPLSPLRTDTSHRPNSGPGSKEEQ